MLHKEWKIPWIQQSLHNVLSQNRHKLTTTRHTNTIIPWELWASATLPQHHRNSCTSSTAQHQLTVSHVSIPGIPLPDTLPLLSPQRGTAKSFCSVLLSHLLSLQNKLIRADVFTSRWYTEKSHPYLRTSPPLPHCTNPFPTSQCWQLFRLLCSSHNPTFLPWLVFTRLPSKTRYVWVLLVCFLHFTVANCNLNLPANFINLYARTVNMKFHGIFLLSFFPP